jgi:hypothetical protein
MLTFAGVEASALDADRSAAFAEMESAYASARAAPFPPASAAFTDVQDIGSPLMEPF